MEFKDIHTTLYYFSTQGTNCLPTNFFVYFLRGGVPLKIARHGIAEKPANCAAVVGAQLAEWCIEETNTEERRDREWL